MAKPAEGPSQKSDRTTTTSLRCQIEAATRREFCWRDLCLGNSGRVVRCSAPPCLGASFAVHTTNIGPGDGLAGYGTNDSRGLTCKLIQKPLVRVGIGAVCEKLEAVAASGANGCNACAQSLIRHSPCVCKRTKATHNCRFKSYILSQTLHSVREPPTNPRPVLDGNRTEAQLKGRVRLLDHVVSLRLHCLQNC